MTMTARLGAGDTSRARHLVAEALSGRAQSLIDTAQLLTSEIMTNALVHASGDVVLGVDLTDKVVRVEIEDSGPMTALAPIYVVAHSEHGRGLSVVDTLATAWGVDRRGRAKAVWFELDLDSVEP